ncbi:unnamed protein product [Cunninghamella echinulata]
MAEDTTSNLSNDKHVLPDQIATANNSSEIDKHGTSETSNTFIRYPPLIYNKFAALDIHDIKIYKCGYICYKVLCRDCIRGRTQHIWTSPEYINTELRKEFEERFRKDFGYSIDKNNHSPNIYNNRPKRYTKVLATFKLSKAYGTELDSSDEELKQEINIKSKKRKRKSSSKKPIV